MSVLIVFYRWFYFDDLPFATNIIGVKFDHQTDFGYISWFLTRIIYFIYSLCSKECFLYQLVAYKSFVLQRHLRVNLDRRKFFGVSSRLINPSFKIQYKNIETKRAGFHSCSLLPEIFPTWFPILVQHNLHKTLIFFFFLFRSNVDQWSRRVNVVEIHTNRVQSIMSDK